MSLWLKPKPKPNHACANCVQIAIKKQHTSHVGIGGQKHVPAAEAKPYICMLPFRSSTPPTLALEASSMSLQLKAKLLNPDPEAAHLPHWRWRPEACPCG